MARVDLVANSYSAYIKATATAARKESVKLQDKARHWQV